LTFKEDFARNALLFSVKPELLLQSITFV